MADRRDPVVSDEMEKDSHTLGVTKYFLEGGFLVYTPFVVHHPDPVPDTRELFNELKVHGSLSTDSQKLRNCQHFISCKRLNG